MMKGALLLFLLINGIAISVLIRNLKQLQNNPYGFIRIICSILFVFCIMRYITLILYATGANRALLEKMRYFYYASSIGIPVISSLMIWYITPKYRDKLKPIYLLLLLAPFCIFYFTIIITQPTNIVRRVAFGYALRLIPPWPFYLSVVQSIFSTLLVLSCICGFLKYKNLQTRSQYIVFIASIILLIIDGICYTQMGMRIIQPFTLTEVFIWLAIYYALCKPTIDYRGIKKAMDS